MRIEIITPSDPLLDLTKVKAHLRVEIADDDVLITGMMLAAEKACEKYIRRFLLSAEVALWFDNLRCDLEADGTIHTPKGKLQSVSQIATYDEVGGETVVLSSDYLVDSVSEQEGRIHFSTLPYGSRDINSVKISCTIGYATYNAVPAILVQGMYMLIAHWYENREAYENGAVPRTIRNLWQCERIMRI